MAKIPEGTVAFLFTDIEGSTKLWEALPAEMKRAVERHDVLCREAIEQRGGYVFKTVGDAFCAAFARAGDAVAAAAAIRRALFGADWGGTPIRARMGVHAGPVELRDGDYFGQTVNRAARISAAGSGGQILVSLAARELSRDSLPPGSTLRDLGSRRLKDISAPERLFQLDEEGMPSDFPPLRTLDSRPNNLPESPTTFFGREEEEATILGLLDTARLVTLTGPGGTGKTRLALECAGALLGRLRDGTWFVDLSRLADPGRLDSEIARALGMAESPSSPIAEALRAKLRESELLLVLDNCEHLVEACASWAADSIAACPGLRVLATSREALMVNGETTYYLSPLPAPPARGVEPSALGQYESVRLFIDRARGAGRSFAVDEQTAPLVAGICERLEGLPLAIELAAAQLRFLPLAELYRRLGDVFGTLRSGTRGGSARQATLRGLMDWSWDLLDEAARRAWTRLSLFRGGFGMDAASTLLGEGAWELVERLAAKSILSMEAAETAEARFRMLETVREYGVLRLEESGEASGVAGAFADWFLAFAHSAEDGLFVLRDPLIYDRLDAELPNIFAGFDATLAVGRRDEAIGAFYDLSAYFFSGRAPVGAAAELLDRLGSGAEPKSDATRAKLLLADIQKRLAFYTVEPTTVAQAESACAAARRSSDADLIARCELARAEICRIEGRFEECFRLALDIAATPPGTRPRAVEAEAAMLAGGCIVDAWGHGKAISPQALLRPGEAPPCGIPAEAGRWEFSRTLKLRALDLARDLGDAFRLHLGTLADESVILGDYPEARRIVEETAAWMLENGLLVEASFRLDFLVTLACIAGDREAAEGHSRRLIDLAAGLGIPMIRWGAEDTALAICRYFRDWEEAERLARAFLKHWEGTAPADRARRELGQVLIELGKPAEAEPLLRACVEKHAAFVAHDPRIAAAGLGLWRIRLERGGDAREAARIAGAALRMLDRLPKFEGPLRAHSPAAWTLPPGLGYDDLARLYWIEVYAEAKVFETYLRMAETAAGPLFEESLREGWALGPEALWPMPVQ